MLTPRGRWRAAGCRAAAPGRARTVWSSARKASSASSPRRGCDREAADVPRRHRRDRLRFVASGTRSSADDRAGQAVARHLRILDPVEAGGAGGLDGTQALVIVVFESSDLSQRHNITEAVAIARNAGGHVPTTTSRSTTVRGRPPAEGLSAHLRVRVHRRGVGCRHSLGLVAAIRTAMTWDRWPEFDATVRSATTDVLRKVFGEHHSLSCRFTHVSRRAGAVLHVDRRRSPRFGDRRGPRSRRPPTRSWRRRWHRDPPSRGRTHASTRRLRPPATRALRRVTTRHRRP